MASKNSRKAGRKSKAYKCRNLRKKSNMLQQDLLKKREYEVNRRTSTVEDLSSGSRSFTINTLPSSQLQPTILIHFYL